MLSNLPLLRSQAVSAAVTCQYLLLTQQCTPGVEALSQIAIFSSPAGNHLTIGAHDTKFPGISALSAAVTKSVQKAICISTVKGWCLKAN